MQDATLLDPIGAVIMAVAATLLLVFGRNFQRTSLPQFQRYEYGGAFITLGWVCILVGVCFLIAYANKTFFS